MEGQPKQENFEELKSKIDSLSLEGHITETLFWAVVYRSL